MKSSRICVDRPRSSPKSRGRKPSEFSLYHCQKSYRARHSPSSTVLDRPIHKLMYEIIVEGNEEDSLAHEVQSNPSKDLE